MLIHKPKYDEISWDYKRHCKELSFSQILRKKYMSYELDDQKYGVSLIKFNDEDYQAMISKVSFTTKIVKLIKEEGIDFLVVGC